MTQNASIYDYRQGMDTDPGHFFSAIKQIKDPFSKELDKYLQQNDEWASALLKTNKIPLELNQIQSRIDSLEEGSELWFAANSVLQTHTLRTALARNDICTAILLGFQLSEFRWQSTVAKQREQELQDQKVVDQILGTSSEEIDEQLEMAGLNAAIEALFKTYPHCNLNALRLLLAKKMGVSKQRLDELDIRPQGL